MNMLTKYFADNLRAAVRFFRSPVAKTDGAEPALTAPLDWFAGPSGVARTWEEALGGASDAPRQQGEQPID